tara:strand:- start:1362 stop:2360 length:999 start_codon:yes stop_codon:yes gene_type:complete
MSNRLKIAQMSVALGEKTRGYLSLGQLADGSPVNMPVAVIRGKQTGPRLFLTAGVHATEAEGVEVARRIINMVAPETLRGMLVVVPVVNVLGFRHSPAARYSPVWLEEEAREIDNSFPGNLNGSSIDRAVGIITKEIISNSDYGIDFHCGRTSVVNLPHVRTYAAHECPNTEKISLLMSAFGTEIVLSIPESRNNIQFSASMQGIPSIMVESGGGLTVSEDIVTNGVEGVLNVMTYIGMLERPYEIRQPSKSFVGSFGVLAPAGGFFKSNVKLKEYVSKGQVLGNISNVFGEDVCEIIAPCSGMVFGVRIAPTIVEGTRVMNIGQELEVPIE